MDAWLAVRAGVPGKPVERLAAAGTWELEEWSQRDGLVGVRGAARSWAAGDAVGPDEMYIEVRPTQSTQARLKGGTPQRE